MTATNSMSMRARGRRYQLNDTVFPLGLSVRPHPVKLKRFRLEPRPNERFRLGRFVCFLVRGS